MRLPRYCRLVLQIAALGAVWGFWLWAQPERGRLRATLRLLAGLVLWRLLALHIRSPHNRLSAGH